MLKTLTIAAITLISAATLAPANAYEFLNGGSENGVSFNGGGSNGITLNGSGENGTTPNGQGDNGVSFNGHTPTVILLGIALPDGRSVAR